MHKRCKPGDMARVICSHDTSLIGQIVVVEEWRPEYDKWGVCLVEGPRFGTSLRTGRFIVSSRYGFKDSSLEPLIGDLERSRIDANEVVHDRAPSRV